MIRPPASTLVSSDTFDQTLAHSVHYQLFVDAVRFLFTAQCRAKITHATLRVRHQVIANRHFQ